MPWAGCDTRSILFPAEFSFSKIGCLRLKNPVCSIIAPLLRNEGMVSCLFLELYCEMKCTQICLGIELSSLILFHKRITICFYLIVNIYAFHQIISKQDIHCFSIYIHLYNQSIYIYIYTYIVLVIWKSDLTNKIKRSFFQAVIVSIVLYGCITWTLTKRLEKKLDGNYPRMLRAILNKSWWQHPTKHQLYIHLPPITKTIQVRRTRHAEHCWRSRDELISDALLWTPTYG